MKNKDDLNSDNSIKNENLDINEKKNKIFQNQIVLNIIFGITIVCLLLYAGYKSSEDDVFEKNSENTLSDDISELSYEEKQELYKKEFEEKKKNINITSCGFDVNKDLIVLVENNNDEVLSQMNLYVIFYDGDNNPIEVQTKNITILEKNGKNYFTIYNTPKECETYQFLLEKKYFYNDYVSYVNDISFETSKEDDEIIINGKNNSDKKINIITFSVIYYDENGKILKISDENTYDVKKNKEFSLKCYNPYDNRSYEKIEYASYDVILTSAYTY